MEKEVKQSFIPVNPSKYLFYADLFNGFTDYTGDVLNLYEGYLKAEEYKEMFKEDVMSVMTFFISRNTLS